jgi:hypothetical protein
VDVSENLIHTREDVTTINTIVIIRQVARLEQNAYTNSTATSPEK